MSVLELHDARQSHLAPSIWHAAASALHRRRRLVDAPCQYTIYPGPVSCCEITRKTTTRVLWRFSWQLESDREREAEPNGVAVQKRSGGGTVMQ